MEKKLIELKGEIDNLTDSLPKNLSAMPQIACSAGDLGYILGMGRSPGEGNGNPLQCSCLENPMDRGAWRDSPQGCKSQNDLATKPLPPLL